MAEKSRTKESMPKILIIAIIGILLILYLFALMGYQPAVVLFTLNLGLLAYVFFIGIFVFWIWMLVDCATKEPNQGNDKIVWVLIIVLTFIIGALLYYIVRRPKRKEEFGE